MGAPEELQERQRGGADGVEREEETSPGGWIAEGDVRVCGERGERCGGAVGRAAWRTGRLCPCGRAPLGSRGPLCWLLLLNQLDVRDVKGVTGKVQGWTESSLGSVSVLCWVRGLGAWRGPGLGPHQWSAAAWEETVIGQQRARGRGHTAGGPPGLSWGSSGRALRRGLTSVLHTQLATPGLC